MRSMGEFNTWMGGKNEGKSQTHRRREEGERNHASVQKKALSSRGEQKSREQRPAHEPFNSKCVHTLDQLCEIVVVGAVNTHVMFDDIFSIHTNPAEGTRAKCGCG